MELCYNQETLLLIYILEFWWDDIFYMLVIWVLIVGEIFFNSAWRMMTICPLVSQKMEQKEGFSFNRLVFSLQKRKFSKSFLTTSWAAEVGRCWERQASVLGLRWPITDFFKMMLWLSRRLCAGWASRVERKMPGNSVMLSWTKPRSLRTPFLRDSNCWGQSLLQLSLSQQTDITNATNPSIWLWVGCFLVNQPLHIWERKNMFPFSPEVKGCGKQTRGLELSISEAENVVALPPKCQEPHESLGLHHAAASGPKCALEILRTSPRSQVNSTLRENALCSQVKATGNRHSRSPGTGLSLSPFLQSHRVCGHLKDTCKSYRPGAELLQGYVCVNTSAWSLGPPKSGPVELTE